jgi:hypothetical protein
MALRRHAVLIHGYAHLVAEAGGRLLGYAYASAFRTRPAYRFTVENSVYVAPGLHRAGPGRALMAEFIARCEARGFRLMVAVIGDSANAPSIGAMGFIPAALRADRSARRVGVAAARQDKGIPAAALADHESKSAAAGMTCGLLECE